MLVLSHNQFDQKIHVKMFHHTFLHSVLAIYAPFNWPEQQIQIPFTYWHFSICWNVDLQICWNKFFCSSFQETSWEDDILAWNKKVDEYIVGVFDFTHIFLASNGVVLLFHLNDLKVLKEVKSYLKSYGF
jgi:hypothetical protein